MHHHTMRVVLAVLCSVGCVCSGYAQSGKKMIFAIKAATESSAGKLTKNIVPKLPQVPAAARQLTIPFPDYVAPSSVDFAALQRKLTQATLNRFVPADPIASVIFSPSGAPYQFRLTSGETVRIGPLQAKHFSKQHKLNATIGYLMRVIENPVVLVNAQTGEKITVFKNDRLRYFSDLQQVCPVGSYLIHHQDGKNEMWTPQQVPDQFAEIYERTYARLNPETPVDFVVEQTPSEENLPQLTALAPLFGSSSYAAPYANVYHLAHHPLNGLPVDIAILKSPVILEKVLKMQIGSMVVRFPDHSFDLYLAGQVPPILMDKVKAVMAKNATPASLAEKTMPELLSRMYDNQTDLARDLHRLFAGQGKNYTSQLLGDFIVYEIPEGIFYQPAGRKGIILDPQKQIVLYFPSRDGGPITDRNLLRDSFFGAQEK